MFWGCFYVPNITGSFNNLLYQSFGGTVNINAQGAFDYVDTGGGNPVGTLYPLTLKTVDGIQFDAKKSHIFYGRTTSTIQPMSTRTLCLVRT